MPPDDRPGDELGGIVNPGAGDHPESEPDPPEPPDWKAPLDKEAAAELVRRLRSDQDRVRKFVGELANAAGRKPPGEHDALPFLYSRAWVPAAAGQSVDLGVRPHPNLLGDAPPLAVPPGDLWFDDGSGRPITYLPLSRPDAPTAYTAHVRVWNLGPFPAVGVTVQLYYWMLMPSALPLKSTPRTAVVRYPQPDTRPTGQHAVVVELGAAVCEVPGRLADRCWAEVEIPFTVTDHLRGWLGGWVTIVDCVLDPFTAATFDYSADRHVSVWYADRAG